jgi:2'-5' RNA ligase superfamily
LSSAPLIVTALMGPEDFNWADGLRRAHFPPERNVLRAHLTMFHHIAPSLEAELLSAVKRLAKAAPPSARLAAPYSLGGGVAYRIDSSDLCGIRELLAEQFWDALIPQDRAPWRPHITVQNKVKADQARALLAALSNTFTPRHFEIAGLAVFRYLGGPWEPVGAWRFGVGHQMRPPPPLGS